MNLNEGQELLDNMLIPLRKNDSCIKANEKLSQSEKNELLQIIVDFERLDETYDYKNALGKIAKIMKRYNKSANNIKKIVIKPDAMPFLIKQVLFYIAVAVKVYHKEETQKTIINYLNSQGLTLSHNFFSRMDVTPTNYINSQRYSQPDLITNYMGQKHGELAVAIKNLVYQAGKYDVYIDIFGGSGAASLAIDKRNDAKYVYNEKNRVVFNLFQVIADKTEHVKLIEELQNLQSDLAGEEIWLDNEVDFKEEIKVYYHEKKKNDTKETDIYDGIGQEIYFSKEEIDKYMKTVKAVILDSNHNWPVELNGKIYTKQELLDKFFPQNPYHTPFVSFFLNYDLLREFGNGMYSYYIRHEHIMGTVKGKKGKKSLQKWVDESTQFRFYMYYAYFWNLLKKGGTIAKADRVRYAVAEIYIQSFRTAGQIGVSSILRMLEIINRPKDAEKFIESDFKEIITNIHKRIKGTICENEDCISVIKGYAHSGNAEIKYKNPLFYSDSPYSGTSDYDDKANGVKAFTPQDMEELIKALRGTGDRFIFSCRAVSTSKPGKKKNEIAKKNWQIYKNVFEFFQSQFVKPESALYVLAIEERHSLIELIQRGDIAELMITNYEICDFKDADFPKVNFKVYDFDEFMEIWLRNAKYIKS